MRTAMSEYLLAPQTKVTLLKATSLPIILLLSLALLTGNFITPLDVLWGICGLTFGGMSLNTIRRYRATTLTIQYDLGSFEVARLLTEQGLLDYTFQPIEPEAFTPSITCALKNAPGYCTPLEMLNKMSEIDELDNRDIQTAVAIVKGSDDDCTFATSPFTSPPMCTMEIFVQREEIVVYDVIDAYIPTGTLSPLVLDCDLPDVATPALTELIKYCEAAIMESNMRDMELF